LGLNIKRKACYKEADMNSDRHIIVTIYLWLNGLYGIIFLFSVTLATYEALGNILEIALLLRGVIALFSMLLLLRSKELGFWLFVGLTIFDFSIGLIVGLTSGYTEASLLIGSWFRLLALYLVLRIKKNGCSAWDNLT